MNNLVILSSQIEKPRTVKASWNHNSPEGKNVICKIMFFVCIKFVYRNSIC